MIAFGVAEAVVHLLEVVQIDHQGGAFLSATGGSEHLRRVFLKSAPVEQAGQAVPVGEFLQLRVQFLEFRGLLAEPVFRCLAFGDVARDAEGKVAAVYEHRAQHDVDQQLAALLAPGKQFEGSAHLPAVRFGHKLGTVPDVACGGAGRDQYFDRLADQLAAVVAEQGLGLGVRQRDAPRLVD